MRCVCALLTNYCRGEAGKEEDEESGASVFEETTGLMLTNVVLFADVQDEDGGTPGTAFVTASDANADGSTGKKERGDAPPQQRYKLTDEIKNIIWQLVTVNNELAAMTNTMQSVFFHNAHSPSQPIPAHVGLCYSSDCGLSFFIV